MKKELSVYDTTKEELIVDAERKMKLKELWKVISPYAHLLITTKIDVGTEEMFDIEVIRGPRKQGMRQQYLDWLFALDLEVESIDACGEDTCGNKNLICVHCKPVKLAG